MMKKRQATERRPFHARALVLALVLVGSVSAAPALADAVGPTIDVWYGDTQTFALPGTPQAYINIVGNVSDVDGVASLSYSLNAGPDVDLTLGTGTSSQGDRRLAAAGDFNIDLATADLDGTATDDSVVITAEDDLGNISTTTVTVDYVAPAGTWAIPSTVTWPAPGGDVNSVSQVVDGEWGLTADGVRTLAPGYDRALAVGDVTWTDYIVTTPVTIHTLAGDIEGSGIYGGFGYLTGWQGHTDTPASVYNPKDGVAEPCGGPLVMQPKCGFEPKGVTARYSNGALQLLGDGFTQYDSTPMTLLEGSTYIFKLRVAGSAGAGNTFALKVWEQGSPEPGPWDVWGQEPLGPDNGALLLTSHHDDVTFGDVTIEPLSLTPPVGVQDLAFTSDLGSVEIDVLANDLPGDIAQPLDPTSVTIAVDPTNGTVAVDPVTGVVTYTHTATGTTTDSFSYVVDDSTDTPSEAIPVALAIGDPAFESDDFNSPTLDPRWTWIPSTAGSYQLVGAGSGDAHLAISVPAGTAHDKWNAGDAPRVMQDASDINFAIEAKYYTEPAVQGNVQGILIEEDAGRWLRFDVQHTGTGLRAFAADTTGNSSVAELSELIAGPVSHLQVTRTNRWFTFAVSDDGETWTEVGAFRTGSTITVNSVGAFASNPFGEAWTSELDFFFHPVAPVDPEDPVATPPATTADEGVVQFDLGSVEVDVLDNDNPGSFPIDPESVAIIDDPANGTVDVNPTTGVVTYTHTAFGTSADSFTYTVDDIVGTTSATTTVSITLERVADEVVLVEPNGKWHIRVPGNDDYTFFYGNPGDVPLFGDWDGDGFDTPGMYRPSNGFAYLTDTLPADGGVGVAEFDFFYGIPGDQVFVGDWDGDGADSLGISRNGKIYLANTNATVIADIEFWFGLPTDIAFGADTDGDGSDSVIVYRESNSFAYYTNDTSMDVAPTDGELFFGIPGDSFTIGDWDADLVDTPGVFRGSDTTVYLKNSLVTGAADESYVWGMAGWTPVAGVHGVVAPPL